MSNRKKCQKERSTEELDAAIQHVRYEFESMMLMCVLYTGQRPKVLPTEVDPAQAHHFRLLGHAADTTPNAFLVALLMHARNLIDFFISHSQRDDDIVADDYFESPKTWSGPLQDDKDLRQTCDNLRETRARMNKKLAHLTYSRIEDRHGWNLVDVIGDLHRLRDRFNALGPRHRLDITLGRSLMFGPSAVSAHTSASFGFSLAISLDQAD